MKKYILPFGIYVLTVPILSYFFKIEDQIKPLTDEEKFLNNARKVLEKAFVEESV